MCSFFDVVLCCYIFSSQGEVHNSLSSSSRMWMYAVAGTACCMPGEGRSMQHYVVRSEYVRFYIPEDLFPAAPGFVPESNAEQNYSNEAAK
jgi:hypothetical protein